MVRSKRPLLECPAPARLVELKDPEVPEALGMGLAIANLHPHHCVRMGGTIA